MYPKRVKFTKKVLPHNLMHLPKLVLLMMVILCLVACQPIHAEPAAQTKTTNARGTPEEEANQALVQRFYEEVFNQRHMNVMDEINDPQGVAHDLGMTPDVGMLFAGLPDLHVTVDLWMLKEDMVTTVVTYNGTHQGEMMGVAPTNKPVTWTHIDIHRVKNGKIVEVWHNIPMNDILQQIGFTLDPPAK